MQPLAADAAGGLASQRPETPRAAGDGGLEALCLLARLHHVAADPAALRHRLGLGASEAAGIDHLLAAAAYLGLRARRSRTSAERLALTPLPALALMADGSVAVLAQCDGQRVLTQAFDGPGADSRPAIAPLADFAARWSGQLILVASRASLAGDLARFDFSWFIPSLVKHRRLLAEVLVVSPFLQLFALVMPLFF